MANPWLRKFRQTMRPLRVLTTSSLTRRILFLNLAGLATLLFGFLYVNQLRQSLIEARLQSLVAQGQIISAAIASSASVEVGNLAIDPKKLLDLKVGESARVLGAPWNSLEFAINPEQVGPVLRQLVTPTRTRARLYDIEGTQVLDSRDLYAPNSITRRSLEATEAEKSLLEQAFALWDKWMGSNRSVPEEDWQMEDGTIDPDVQKSMQGQTVSFIRQSKEGEIIASVAVPVQRFRAIFGALVLSTLPGDIDRALAAERQSFLRVFVVAAVVMSLLSILLASTIAGPVRRLAEAAERVRRRVNARVDIPDYTGRDDEIGHLSQALRDMTRSLYDRIAGIEQFAADVAHELKNPLTSLRSAVETLPLAREESQQKRLHAVIVDDIKRLDRLISDISDASRLDAELQREEARPVDMAALIEGIISLANDPQNNKKGIPVRLEKEVIMPGTPAPFTVHGHAGRLAQVFNNLIDNARSFAPEGSEIVLHLNRQPQQKQLEVRVEDSGPGIRPDMLGKIFERFYTDRPSEHFGQNSGLGLSISKQIMEAHAGSIHAENRMNEAGAVLGAAFILRLPQDPSGPIK